MWVYDMNVFVSVFVSVSVSVSVSVDKCARARVLAILPHADSMAYH